jgi:hypothetical protein
LSSSSPSARNQLERPRARGDPDADDKAARNRGDRQRPRSPSGHAEGGEPGHTQLVGNRMRVGGDRCEPERRRGGATVARPVEGNEPDAALGRKLLPKAKVQPGTRVPCR